eukprot:Rhum_TRINITY_DN14967_c17_g1::Rhum_TRINITY_DN14967_c17_g1_i1::g.131503::m.131503
MPSITGWSDTASETGKKLSMWTAYVFTINVVFGSGVLAMPHAIQSAGFGLGGIMLVVVSCIAWTTVMWVCEAISRLCFVNTLYKDLVVKLEDEDGPLIPKDDFSPAVVSRLVAKEDFEQLSAEKATIEQLDREWECNELCSAFLGPRWGMVYDACLCLYTWAVMWLYVTVWCQAFVTIIPLPHLTSFKQCDDLSTHECLSAYRWFVLVFVVAMSVLCVRNWKIFDRIQSTFTVYAYICLAIMLITAVIGLYTVPYKAGGYHAVEADTDVETDVDGYYSADVTNDTKPYIGKGNKFADMSQFSALFGCCIFSQMAHQGTSQILFVMSDKNHAGKLFAFSFLTTSLFYTALSVAAGLYFGSHVNQIVTLNWEHYSFYADGHENWLSDLLFVLIVIFPVGTTSAAYMFFVRTLGAQMEHWMTKQLIPHISNTLLCKVIAFTPPIIGGIATHNVDTIVKVAGLLGFTIMIFFPAALQLRSIRVLEDLGVATQTPFSGWQSHIPCVYGLLVVGSAGFVFYIYNIFA